MNSFSNKVHKLSQVVWWLSLDGSCARKQRILVSECGWDVSLLRFQRLFKHEFIRKDFKSVRSFDPYDWVIPISSQAYHDLDAELQNHDKLLNPKPEVFNLCDNKRALQDHLIALGYEAVLPLPMDGRFPRILKPVDEYNSHGVKLINDQAELDQFSALLEQGSHILQSYVSGTTEVASHILIRGGEILHAKAIEFYYRAEPYISVQNGPYLRKMIADPFLDLWHRLLVDIKYEGVCCIDYKSFGGKAFLMEINPRLGGSFREYAFSMMWPLQREETPKL